MPEAANAFSYVHAVSATFLRARATDDILDILDAFTVRDAKDNNSACRKYCDCKHCQDYRNDDAS